MKFKVYFPTVCANSPDGILLGTLSPDHSTAYVLAVAQFPLTSRKLTKYLLSLNIKNDVVPIGLWYSSKNICQNAQTMCQLFKCEEWLCVSRNEAEYNIVNLKHNSSNETPLLFLYNQEHFWEETCDTSALRQKSVINKRSSSELFSFISRNKSNLLSPEAALLAVNSDLKILNCCTEKDASLIFFMFTLFSWWFAKGLGTIAYYTQVILQRKVFKPLKVLQKLFCYLIKFTSMGCHLCKKSALLIKSLNGMFKKKTKENFDQDSWHHYNIVTSVIMDMIFGVTFIVLLTHYGIPKYNISNDMLLVWVEYIGHQVV